MCTVRWEYVDASGSPLRFMPVGASWLDSPLECSSRIQGRDSDCMQIHYHTAVAALLCSASSFKSTPVSNFKFSIEKEPLQKPYCSPEPTGPPKRQRLDSTSPILSGKCASVLPFVKLPKDGMDMLIIRRPFGTVSIPE